MEQVKKLEELLRKHEADIEHWVEIINEMHPRYMNREKPEDEGSDPLYALSDILGKMSDLFFKFGSFKDTFDNSKMYINFEGPSLIIVSSKTGIKFDFGIDSNSIYLHTYFREAENLRYMSDEFYRDLLSLEALGAFKVAENEGYSFNDNKVFSEVFANNTSNVFKLFRQYYAGVSTSDFKMLGDFEISWTTDTDFYDIVRKASLAFKTLYKMNYALWKVSDLKAEKAKD